MQRATEAVRGMHPAAHRHGVTRGAGRGLPVRDGRFGPASPATRKMLDRSLDAALGAANLRSAAVGPTLWLREELGQRAAPAQRWGRVGRAGLGGPVLPTVAPSRNPDGFGWTAGRTVAAVSRRDLAGRSSVRSDLRANEVLWDVIGQAARQRASRLGRGLVA
jgi:hypothetical protein